MAPELLKIKTRFDAQVKLYEQTYNDTIDSVSLDGVILKEALKNQIDLQLAWEVLVKRINKTFELCELEVESTYAAAVSAELKNAYKTVNITEAKEYAKANPDYQDARKLLIDIREVRDEAKGILSAIESRKYILNNITNAVVASAESHII
jgi:hypothetical protein